MNKAVLCIGGSELQLPTLNWAKQAGLRVLLSDGSPNPPGRELADAFAQIPGDDAESLITFARAHSSNMQIVSAYCSSDFGLLSVCRINQFLGRSGLDPAAVEISLHKARANQILREAGLPVPDGFVLSSDKRCEISELSYPVIVKPVDGSGSRGVSRVECAEKLPSALANAQAISPEVMVEQVIEGEHLDVSGFFANGRFYPGGQLERFFSPLPYRYPTWGCQPPGIELEEQQHVYKLLERAARTLQLVWGPVKADVIRGPDGPVLIEVTPRFHGDVSTSFCCPLAHGVSPVQHWMQWLSNARLPEQDVFLRDTCKAGWAGIFPRHVGTVETINGVQQALGLPGIVKVLLRRGPGWPVQTLSDNRAVLGFVFATGDNSDEVRQRLTTALKKIHVVMSDNMTV
jgi:biotin carboxylase